MKKFLLTLMTLVIVVVSAVGCGESGAGSAGQTPTESDWIEVERIEYTVNDYENDYYQYNMHSYHYSSDELHSVKIRFVGNDCLEVKYFNDWDRTHNNQHLYYGRDTYITLRVKPISYTIVYLND